MDAFELASTVPATSERELLRSITPFAEPLYEETPMVFRKKSKQQ